MKNDRDDWYLNDVLQEGLRTLAIAKKIIPEDEYHEINRKVCSLNYYMIPQMHVVEFLFLQMQKRYAVYAFLKL
jgi:hypothetical protein